MRSIRGNDENVEHKKGKNMTIIVMICILWGQMFHIYTSSVYTIYNRHSTCTMHFYPLNANGKKKLSPYILL